MEKNRQNELKALVSALINAETTFQKAGENHINLIRAFTAASISKDQYLDEYKKLIDPKAKVNGKVVGTWPTKETKEGLKDKGYQTAMKEGYAPAVAYNRFQAVAGKLEYDERGFPIADGNEFKKATKPQTPKSKATSKSKGSLTGDAPTEGKTEEHKSSAPVLITKDTVRLALDILAGKYIKNPDISAMLETIAEAEGLKLNPVVITDKVETAEESEAA